MAIVRTSKRLKTDVAVFLPDSFLYQFRLRRNDIQETAVPFLARQINCRETALPSPLSCMNATVIDIIPDS